MPRQQTPADLPRIFRDPARAQRDWTLLHEMFIRAGSRFSLEQFSRMLHGACAETADPDAALTHLLRFSEASFSTAALFNDLVQYPAYADLLLRLFATSRYFADILVREPELFRWLTASEVLSVPLTREALLPEVGRIARTFQQTSRRLDALKRVYRREILRIGAQDILGAADLTAITQQISDLADVLIQAVAELAVVEARERFPAPPRTPWTVIGLGKLGGRELNYSSDIDVMFVYGDEGEVSTVSGSLVSHHEYFIALAERITRALAEPTAEGHLYRVDTRLRPEGNPGPLARSVHSMLLYYESRGELWERQMLLKARPVAGDAGFGALFLKQLEPFVFPRTFFQHPAEAIGRIKARIEASVGDEANIKLRAGGIRDIEFIVQTLQLLNGGKNARVRETNTLRALARLAEERLLSDEEARVLTEAYIFYRRLEHRLQMMQNTQTHVVPSEPEALDGLARRMGLRSGDVLQRESAQRLRAVRAIYEAVLSVPAPPEEAGIAAVADGNLPEEAVHRLLAGYGVRDTRQGARVLRTMVTGGSLRGLDDLDTRARDAFRAVSPVLFAEVARTPDPDMTLRNLGALVAAQRFPGQLYTQLRDERFRRLLLDLCALSPRFVRMLVRNPLLLESAAADIGALASGPMLTLPPAGSLQAMRAQQEWRAGVRNLLGFTSFEELTGELSHLAEFIVTALFTDASRALRRKRVPLAVFALGKLGTHELGFDSDLDLFCVADAEQAAQLGTLDRLASRLIQQLTAVTEHGSLYAVDARLRPEGKNAPLIVSLVGYAQYLRTRASLWERQSLTRLRYLCGDARVGREVERMVADHVYGTPLPDDWVKATVAMRKRMETRSRLRSSSTVDIKLGAGGMADVEFLAQMIQLSAGGAQPHLRGRSVPVLLQMEDLPILGASERHFLRSAYLRYREVEKLMRITLEERGSILPEGEKLDLLARCLARSARSPSGQAPAAGRGGGSRSNQGEALAEEIRSTMARVRRLFTEAAERIRQRSGSMGP